MAKTGPGRPPIQHIKHVHTIALSPELEEKIDGLREAFIIGNGARAAGVAAKGILSHPAGLVTLTGIALFLWIKFLGGEKAIAEGGEAVMKWAADIATELNIGLSQFAVDTAVAGLNLKKAFLDFIKNVTVKKP